ncbi:hypothetical protein B0H11DRAFT_2255826 [Mycena galericulata]|nr:hypothetical protein B0H11DRAFT_2255826 [Mycena galericulata]
MPYSVPGTVPLPFSSHSVGRTGHRRSYSLANEEKFLSQGALLRRTPASDFTTSGGTHSRQRGPLFHFRTDEDEGSSSESDEFTVTNNPDAFTRVNQNSVKNVLAFVPFPRTSPPLSSDEASVSNVIRTVKTPEILLSNGRPLKSSLKSNPHARNMHPARNTRAKSAPSLFTPTPSVSQTGEASSSICKAVHFPSPSEGLESVLLFKCRARPASVSLPLNMDDETETETEVDLPPRWLDLMARSTGSARSVLGPGRRAADADSAKGEWRYELDVPGVLRKAEGGDMVLLERVWLLGGCSSSPSSSQAIVTMPYQSLPEGEIALHGTVIVRNAALEKRVSVRFTLDEWCTTNEVGARWVGTVPTTPSTFPHLTWSSAVTTAATGEGVEHEVGSTEEAREEPGPGWDRFAFSIRLTDYAHTPAISRLFSNESAGVGESKGGLAGRKLVMVAHFAAPCIEPGSVGPYAWCGPDAFGSHHRATGTSPSGRSWVGTGAGGAGDWWDNNRGHNYRFGFRMVPTNEIPMPSAEATGAAVQPATVAPSCTPSSTYSPAPYSERVPSFDPGTAHTSGAQSNMSAKAKVLAARLGRLRLPNYAAPVSAVVRGEVMSAGVGQGPQNQLETEDDRSSVATSVTEDQLETPPTAPEKWLPMWLEEGAGTKTAEEFHAALSQGALSSSPVEMPTAPSASSTTSSAITTMASPADQYKMFVRQWCFVGAEARATTKIAA